MKLTDHAKNLSLAHEVSDDSRLGEAFLIVMEAMKQAQDVYYNEKEGSTKWVLHIEEALAEIEEL